LSKDLAFAKLYIMIKKILSYLPLGRLAIVPFSGTITKKDIDDYIRLFKALEDMKNIKGVLFEIESPGGSATQSECLYERLKRLNDKKPLYCYAHLAASGGYMAALGARKIYAPSTAVIGSIGVISIKPVLRELMERFGIKIEVMKKGQLKDMTLFHRESTEEEKQKWDSLNEAIYRRFIEIVSERRALSIEAVRGLATGELFVAGTAKELGLIDGIMDIDSAIEELSKETGVRKEKTITIKPRKPLMRRLFSEASSALADELIKRIYMN